jgi:hypothetical protein
MELKRSKRILVLGERDSGALGVVKGPYAELQPLRNPISNDAIDLTGSTPEPGINGSIAGLTHEWIAETPYYTAKVPVWVDELSDIEAWKSEFLKPEAKEVVDAVGAWVLCFKRQPDGKISEEMEHTMKGVQEVLDTHSDGSHPLLLAVVKPVVPHASDKSAKPASQDEQEDACIEYGFEYIDYNASGKNEFGEKLGFERLKEALETNEWDADDGGDLDLAELGLDVDGDFGHEEAEMTAELFGLKAALNGDTEPDDDSRPLEDQSGQVDDLDHLMGKLLAIKEAGADLPEDQRKRMAAKAVRDLMADVNF